MILYVSPAEGEHAVTVVAGRRIGNAVARNRARRILRAAWREVAAEAPPGIRSVLAARPAIVGAKTRDLVEEMRELLRRAEVLAP